MINEEEKKAIKYFYNLRSTIDESYMLFDEEINLKCGKEMIKQITIFLNLITKLQKENEEKDKQIDLMAGEIEYAGCIKKVWKCDQKNCKDCIKQYFKKLAKEKGE